MKRTDRLHTVLIGGTRGLGRALAQLLVSEGANVSAIARKEPSAKVENVLYESADITDTAKLVAALQAVVQARGAIDSLVFLQRYRGPATPDLWSHELETSLSATKRAIEAAVPHFSSVGPRSIVIVSSVYGSSVGDGQDVSYQVSKAAVIQLARHYAMTLGPRGIRVNVVSPGSYLKDESSEYVLADKQYLEMMQRIVPLQRIGKADEVAEVIAFLCSSKSSLITGQNLIVDGGLSIIWPESAAASALGRKKS